MALIIKGDMPQGCWQGDVMNRTFCDWYDYCRGRCIPPKGFVPSDCPIIGEIPDKHGDLISKASVLSLLQYYCDMREYMKDVRCEDCENRNSCVVRPIMDEVNKLDTVLEATNG